MYHYRESLTETAIRQLRQLSCILDSCTIAASCEVSQAQKALLLMPRTAKGASTSSGDFFFRSGRSRSKARSLHETKLLVRKLLHGRRWSHEAWQITTRKTTNTQKTKNRARRRSPSQICVLPFERQQSKQPTGPEPNKKNHKRFAKDTVVKTHCVTIKTKTCSKRIMPPRNVRHANYVVASKVTRSRVHYTLETNPASQNPLTSTCSRAQIQRKTKYQLA